MRKKIKLGLAAYLITGAVIYLAIKLLAGGLGLIGTGGPVAELLELSVTILAWPVIVLLSFAVVIQGR